MYPRIEVDEDNKTVAVYHGGTLRGYILGYVQAVGALVILAMRPIVDWIVRRFA